MSGLVPFNKKNGNSLGFGDWDDMFDNFFPAGWFFGNKFLNDSFKIDVEEKENDYVVEAQLPGVKKEDINIGFDDGRLNISVQSANNVEKKSKNYIHRESRYSAMQRSIYLDNAKAEGISAKLENGILSISVPKSIGPDKQNKIEIQ